MKSNRILIFTFDPLYKKTFASSNLYGNILTIDGYKQRIHISTNKLNTIENLLHIIPENRLYHWNKYLHETQQYGRLINLMFEISKLNSILYELNRKIHKIYK